MTIKKLLALLVFTFSFIFASTALAAAIGTIDAGNKYTKICHDTSCTTFGTINFKPTINGSTPGALPVTITNTSITGHLWGDEIGWVNLAPTGLSAPDVLKVDPNTGIVTGKAFSNGGSWINFNPTTVGGGTTVGVTINSSGEFEGWAWVSGLYGGWMKFDCSDPSTCIKTDWTPDGVVDDDSDTSGGGRAPEGTPITPTSGSTTVPTAPVIPPTDNVSLDSVEEDTPEQSPTRGENQFPQTQEGAPVHTPPTEYYDISLDGDVTIYTQDGSPCFFCIVKRVSVFAGAEESIIKYGFIPKPVEIPIPVPFVESSVDLWSILLTGLGSFGLYRFIRFIVSFF
jgi:hypothetical protein